MREYRHLKTGNIYCVIATVTNATNAQSGQVMYLYHARGKPEQLFVRAKDEFELKFEHLI